MLCQDCKKNPTCVQLCEKAEKYVDRDSVSLRESQQSDVALDLLAYHLDEPGIPEMASFFAGGTPAFPFLTPLQNKILGMFYFDGLSRKQIAYRLSNQHRQLLSTSVESHLARARKKIRLVFYRGIGEQKTVTEGAEPYANEL
jgi:hypothetical protein